VINCHPWSGRWILGHFRWGGSMDKLDKQLAQAAQVKPRDIDYSARGKFQPELAKVP